MTTAEATKQVTFISKVMNQVLTMRPAMEAQHAPNGALLMAGDPGVRVEFQDHRVVIEDPELLDWLRDHRLFNVAFWEEGSPPDEPRPTVDEQMDRIQELGHQNDAEGLNKVIAEEKALHNRAVVLRAADRALGFLVQPDNKTKAKKGTEENSKSQPPSKASETTSTPSQD